MSDREKWLVDGVLNNGDTSVGASLLRAVLTPLAFLHRWGLEAYLLPFALGWRKRFRLPVPVVSVGNLSSGGTGKTPATAFLAEHFVSTGKRVVILSRGHGGAGERANEPRIVSDGEKVLLSPEEAGDEPVLLANLLPGVPVIVCRDRRKSGRLAVEMFAPDIVLLDDGLQYWQLHRDFDIILLDAKAPFGNGYVLPRGLLREPPSHLARADAVVLTRADRVDADTLARTKAHVQTFTRPGVPVLTATHTPEGWICAGKTLPLSALVGQKAVVFSAIADNEAFAVAVRNLGVEVVGSHFFPDHHAYTSADLQAIATTGAGAIGVTTEKDAVKLAALPTPLPFAVYALRIRLTIAGADALTEEL
ncbi:MAG: tetraacyldisaccharide 4'-kinase, partial [Armatimonadetes bacterium]|nr:tetraacyldisaccharide 4'-kinase [Armatimonadota bacterium]